MKKLLKKLIPDFILYWYHWKLAFLAAVIYGWPSRRLKVIGVTGTKGKSTVVYLAGKILQGAQNNSPQPPLSLRGGENINPSQPPFVKGGAIRVGWISSLTINDGKNEVINPYHMTMPGRFFIQKTLRAMAKNGCKYALVEVTSEGIKQHRHRFINWAGAVFTNLAPEHLEAHGGFENYKAAKEKLFAATSRNKESFGVYNLDDENAKHFLAYGIKNKYGYTLKNNFQFSIFNFQSIFNVKNVQLNANGSKFEINGVKFKTNLLGEFNVYNCAAAAVVGLACGVPLETAALALGKIEGVPGRLEIINEGQDFMVVVDLAHTLDSFSQVFKLFGELRNKSNLLFFQGVPCPTPTVSPFQREEERKREGDTLSPERGEKKPKIISVFGSAGGGRDKWKRPELGKIASQYSDQIFIANEDPYDEDPRKIANEILAGCDKNKTDIILDRRAAIARALSLARADDIILVLGKGTEQIYAEGGKKISWDDRIVVREEIKKIKRVH